DRARATGADHRARSLQRPARHLPPRLEAARRPGGAGRARLRGSDRTAARRPRPATVAHGAGTPGDREGLAMSWRETLGIAEAAGEPHAHNPQNAQKTAMPGNSADSADSASADAEEAASRLLEALSDACHDLPITPAAVRDALAPE